MANARRGRASKIQVPEVLPAIHSSGHICHWSNGHSRSDPLKGRPPWSLRVWYITESTATPKAFRRDDDHQLRIGLLLVSTTHHHFQVFFASPSDTEVESRLVEAVVDNVNDTLKAANYPVTLVFQAWKNLPTGGDPQSTQHYIDSKLPAKDWDIVIGLFKTKFGIPNPALGGRRNTEHELETALDLWKKTGWPHVHLYFAANNAVISPEQAEQVFLIQKFKKRMEEYFHHKTAWFSDGIDLQAGLWKDLFSSAVSRYAEMQEKDDSGLRCLVKSGVFHARAEGVVEAAGAITLSVSGGRLELGSGAPYFYDLELWTSPSVNLTNSLESVALQEATMLGARLIAKDGFETVYAGQLVRPNVCVFKAIRFAPWRPRGVVSLSVSGVSVNCSQLGVASGGVGAVALVIIAKPRSSETPPLEMDYAAPNVILARNSISFYISNQLENERAVTFPRNEGINSGIATEQIVQGSAATTLQLTFEELNYCVFRTVAEERAESEYELPSGEVCGTRLMVRFSQVSSGVRLFAGTSGVVDQLYGPQAVMVSSDFNGTGGNAVGGHDFVEIPIYEGTGQAVWEWIGANPSPYQLRTLRIPIVLQALPGQAIVGKALTNGNLCPISTVSGASPSAPIPRFVDTSANRVLFICE